MPKERERESECGWVGEWAGIKSKIQQPNFAFRAHLHKIFLKRKTSQVKQQEWRRQKERSLKVSNVSLSLSLSLSYHHPFSFSRFVCLFYFATYPRGPQSIRETPLPKHTCSNEESGLLASMQNRKCIHNLCKGKQPFFAKLSILDLDDIRTQQKD